MISHPRKTLFVHIPKTGGQSVETVFLNDLGLKWDERAVLGLRRNDDPGAGPERLAHLYGDEYVRLGHVTGEQFDSYTRFAIIRHPYDRMISEYRWRMKTHIRRGHKGDLPTFDAFLNRDLSDEYSDVSRHMQTQVRYLLDGQGRCLVSHILRFERLAEDIAPVFRKIFGKTRVLPHANRGDPAVIFGRDNLTKAHKDLLAERYRVDFETFGYAP